MDAAQSAEFTRRLVGLAEVFDVKLSAQRVALYFEALRDLELADVVRALNQAVKVSRFFPKPAEVRSLAVGDTEDRVERAWMAFKSAMRIAGSYASLEIHDPALAESIISLFGSWPQACAEDLSPEMWSARRKEFGRIYRVTLDRDLIGSRRLPGICEQRNAGLSGNWHRFVPVHQISITGEIARGSLPSATVEQLPSADVAHEPTSFSFDALRLQLKAKAANG